MQENYNNDFNEELSQPTVVYQVPKYKWLILGSILIVLVILFGVIVYYSSFGFSFGGSKSVANSPVAEAKYDYFWIDYHSDDGDVYSWKFTDSDTCERTNLVTKNTDYYTYVDNGSFVSIDNDKIVLYYDNNEGVFWYFGPDLKYKYLLCRSLTNEYNTEIAMCYKYRADTGDAIVNEIQNSIEQAEKDGNIIKGNYDEYKEIYNLSSEEVYEKYLKNAVKAYSMFDGLGGPYCEYDVTYDADNDGYTWTYYLIESDQRGEYDFIDFSSYKALKKSLNEIFTSDLVDKLLGYGNFIEADGKMYACCHGRGSDIYYVKSEYAVTDVKDDKIELTVYAEYVKEEYFDSWEYDYSQLTDDMVDDEEIKFTMKKQGGKWKFDKFTLWY